MNITEPIRVAIVGGGCAGVATAFELSRPEHRGRYEVTVYQLGWRLGGKGASGRDANGRIEEHGLHLWLGYYENAFRLMREAYDELGRDPSRYRIADWQDAFVPDPLVALADQESDGQWSFWTACFPTNEDLPGDPFLARHPFSLGNYLVRAAELLRTLLISAFGLSDHAPDHALGSTSVAELRRRIVQLLRSGQLVGLTGLLEATRILEMGLQRLGGRADSLLLNLIDVIGLSLRTLFDTVLEEDPQLRRFWSVIDLMLAFVRGIVSDGLLHDPRGLDAIDSVDGRTWLRRHGASPRTLDSTFLRSVYDLSFAYRRADPRLPRMAAGQMLRGFLRLFFTYRGALFWKMQAGMGDVVFAPFFEVLQRRGVKFRFFHRLEEVRLAAENLPPDQPPWVEALEFDVQAEIQQDKDYRPLQDVDGLPCWPSAPDWSQLVDGTRLRDEGWDFESHWDRRRATTRTLVVGEDFDVAVLAVGLGAVPYVCRDLLERDRRWRAMVTHLETVATQSFQLWMHADMGELGIHEPSVNSTGFVQPFDTWSDMSHLLTEEDWSAPKPRALVYFCNVLPTPEGTPPREARGYPAHKHAEVRRNAVRFLERHVQKIWPGSHHRSGGFRWEILATPENPPTTDQFGVRATATRFDSQFWTANVNPSDRYVLSLPGTQKYRISPLDPTYENLVVAGDWTDCGHNQGCVESAVMSGRLAAHAITGKPLLEEIIGYDHP